MNKEGIQKGASHSGASTCKPVFALVHKLCNETKPRPVSGGCWLECWPVSPAVCPLALADKDRCIFLPFVKILEKSMHLMSTLASNIFCIDSCYDFGFDVACCHHNVVGNVCFHCFLLLMQYFVEFHFSFWSVSISIIKCAQMS